MVKFSALYKNTINSHKLTVRMLFLLGFVFVQSYALYASTSHLFHDTMPMCPVCVAIKSYEHSAVNTTVSIYVDNFVTEQVALTDSIQVLPSFKFHHQSRAPPLV